MYIIIIINYLRVADLLIQVINIFRVIIRQIKSLNFSCTAQNIDAHYILLI